jgi:two-component system cell cycle sensor histidine kinase/response regulator CckA
VAQGDGSSLPPGSPLFVDVPDEVAPLFRQAELIVADLFSQRVATPEQAAVEIAGERYLLIRAASMSVQFYELVRQVLGPHLDEASALAAARELLYDLAHAIGRADARALHERTDIVDPVMRLAVGPSHFAHTGWGRVRIHEGSELEGDIVLHYDHLHSFEADAYKSAGRDALEPICVMNAGYSAGWCTQSFGVQLESTEVSCRAMGHAACRFVLAPRERVADRVAELERNLGRELSPTAAYIMGERLLDKLAAAERAARAGERLEATATLAGGIAHDFNNLMAGVLGHVAFIRRGRPPWEETEEVLNRVELAASRASGLSQQLLSYARGGKYAEQDLALSELVREVVREVVPQRVPTVALELTASSDTVSGDPAQLRQLVASLLRNAVEATRGGGQVQVSTHACRLGPEEAEALDVPAGAYAVLQVSDTGTGMSAAVLARAFEPYFSTKSRGRGLGLAAAYGVVKNHGGGISLESESGSGATVRVYLPRAGTRRLESARQSSLRPSGWLERQGSLEAVGSLAMGSAHELDALLQAATQAHAEASAAGFGTPTADEACERASAALGRCRQLTERLLALGRRSQEPSQEVALSQVARDVAVLMAHVGGAKVELGLELAEGLPPVTVARRQLNDALVNLVFNSRDALPAEGGQITLATGLAGADTAPGPGDWVWIEVRNTGKDSPREPASQTPLGNEEDVGLGMTMADRFVRAAGGQLRISWRHGAGRQVTILLPVSAQATIAPVKSRRVLVVDDNEHVARSTAQLLRLEGMGGVEAGSGEEALALVDAGESFDVVLLDLVLPGLSGPETFAELRKRLPGLPVVVFSGYGEQDHVQDLVAKGALFLSKPFTVEGLLDVLNRAIEKGG